MFTNNRTTTIATCLRNNWVTFHIQMERNRSFWQWLVRRPYKLVKNFLKIQIIVSLLAAIIVGLLPIDKITTLDDETDAASGAKMFTKDQLLHFNGDNGKPMFLSILGSVYDVSKGIKHYGPGSAYNSFVGRDASVAFITGEFDLESSEADDVLQYVKGKDLIGLVNWKGFYDKSYVFKGKFIGRFYNEQGEITEYHKKFLAAVQHAKQIQEKADQLLLLYPDCNIEWSEEMGSHVWCTKSSGGRDRNWIGYPRKLYEIGNDNFRCACVRKEDLQNKNVMLKEYENCDAEAHECYYKVD